MQGNANAVDYFCRNSSLKWLGPAKRSPAPWLELLVPQCEDAKGASVLLTILFRSSAEMVRKSLNDEILDKFKDLVRVCGPMTRFVDFFASVCFVQGEPIRWAQEACYRKLVMNPHDRYAFGVTFHPSDTATVTKALAGSQYTYPYPPMLLPSGKEAPAHVRIDRFNKAPEHYLGKRPDGENAWPPLCVVWTSPLGGAAWGAMAANSGRGLYWAPKDLGLPSVGPLTSSGMKGE